MSTQVIMPQLGESVIEGTIGAWLIAEGQPVKEYEPLLQITTDKVDTEIPAPASGILLKIHVPAGATVAKGTLLAEIGDQPPMVSGQASGVRRQEPEGHDASATDAPAPHAQSPISATPVAQRVADEHGVDLAQVQGTGLGGRITREDVEAYIASESRTAIEEPAPTPQALISNPQSPAPGFISPAVARLSGELGVDLTQVIGTGEGGRVTKKDVLAYVAAPVPRETAGIVSGGRAGFTEELPPWEQPGTGSLFKPTDEIEAIPASGAAPTPGSHPPIPDKDVEVVPLTAIRRAIAGHMLSSKRTSPHVTTVMEADMTRVVQVRERLRGEYERQGVKLTFTPFFIQAIVAGLKAVPAANSSFTENALMIHKRIHIGMAVAIPDGLIVPVIRDADEKSLLGLARAVDDLAARARAKRLAPDEVQGGTFTLTNHGTAGSLFATPIINQPQAGILGVGAIQKRPVVISRGHPLLPDAEDVLAIRPMVYLSFTFDHRVLDGQEADGFLAEVQRFLERYSG